MNRRDFLRTALLPAGALLGGGWPRLRAAQAYASSARRSHFAQPAMVEARILAVGLPGAGAIAPVGRFLPGGPIHDSAPFAAYTQPGRTLDPTRLLVGARSNFGAPLADPASAPGALLSLDRGGSGPLSVPPGFAAADGQASALGGSVQIFSAQSPAFINGLNNPNAVTAAYAGVSNPHGLSINNAFGRIWPANVPGGLGDPSSESILDPTGIPLASPPSPIVGGVFAGSLTGRQPQLLSGGLTSGAVGTAFLGKSPDGSARAVFAAVLADGSAVQMHTEQGLDGLAPAGTITPLIGSAGTDDLRIGAAVDFEPVRILYVTDPLANMVVALTLRDDRRIFFVDSVDQIQSGAFNLPVGLAPAQPEVEDTDWASNTTLFEFSDLYVANRGDNTVVRMRTDGTVVAIQGVTIAGQSSLGDARISSIATSSDGSRVWLTVTGALPGFPDQDGAVLEIPAFGGD